MNRCRCDEISSHNDKITKLNNKLEAIKTCDDEFNNLASDLNAMAFYNLAGFHASKMTTLNSNIRGLNDSLEKVRDKIMKKIQDKINQLESELSKMEKEDKEYHKEQEEKEKEGQP